MIAVSSGRENIVDMLIGKNSDVNARNTNGQSCLHYACSKNLTSIAEKLIKHGADVNARDKFGNTPLHRAASKGYNSILKLLLSCKNIEVSCPDSIGNTPL